MCPYLYMRVLTMSVNVLRDSMWREHLPHRMGIRDEHERKRQYEESECEAMPTAHINKRGNEIKKGGHCE